MRLGDVGGGGFNRPQAEVGPLPALPIDLALARVAQSPELLPETGGRILRIGDPLTSLSLWRVAGPVGGWRAVGRLAAGPTWHLANASSFLLLWEVATCVAFASYQSSTRPVVRESASAVGAPGSGGIGVAETLPGLGEIIVRLGRGAGRSWFGTTRFQYGGCVRMYAPTFSSCLSGAAVGWEGGLSRLLARPPPAGERRASRRPALTRGWSSGSLDAALARVLAPWRVAGSPGRGDLGDAPDDELWPWWRDDEVYASGEVDPPEAAGPGRYRCRAVLPGLGEYLLVASDPLVAVMAACEALRLLSHRPFLPRFSLHPARDYRARPHRSVHPPPLQVSGHLPSGEAARIYGRQVRRGEWRYELVVGDAPPLAAHGVTALGALVNLVPAWR